MAEKESAKWTYEHKKLLLDCRLSMEPEFSSKNKKRTVLWGQVLQKMREKDENVLFSRNNIARKYLNMMTTYKRIKKRNNTTGEATTKWDYFGQFDEVYGSRHDVVVPETNLDGSLNSLFSDLTNESTDAIEDVPLEPKPTSRKRARVDIFEFLRAGSDSDKKNIGRCTKMRKRRNNVGTGKVARNKKIARGFRSDQ